MAKFANKTPVRLAICLDYERITYMQRQTSVVKKNDVTRKWYVIDAANKPLGRLASQVAVILMGKDKPNYTPNVDCGDYSSSWI